MIEELINILLNNAAVLAIQSDRLYPQTMPSHKTYPATVLHRISLTGNPAKDVNATIHRSRIQTDHLAKDYQTALQLADATIEALEGYEHGDFINITHQNTRDSYNTDVQIHRVINEFQINYRRI